jgi:hypothetical protein
MAKSTLISTPVFHLDQYSCVLETAYDVGLRSPGYCHDLFISMEAVTPGQFKSGGAGVKPGCGFHETAFGRALIALSNNGTDPMLISYLRSQISYLRKTKRYLTGMKNEISDTTFQIPGNTFPVGFSLWALDFFLSLLSHLSLLNKTFGDLISGQSAFDFYCVMCAVCCVLIPGRIS